MNGLDLFSGIGGNSLGLQGYVRTIAYCEADRHAQAVLLSRMHDGQLPIAPICTDVRRLDGQDFRGFVDIIIAGFPCQDISCAGKGAGLEGKRSGLFYEVVRLAKEIKPAFLFLENVPAIRKRGMDRVVEELTAIGYDLRWTMLAASDIGAPHKRQRWFLLAHAQSDRNKRFGLSGTDAAKKRKKDPKSRSKTRPTNLQVQVNTSQFWPTPRATDGQKNQRTMEGVIKEVERKGSPQDLLSAVRFQKETGGQLNPTWVEWLMGFPSGWTELNALGMQWFQRRREKRLKCS